MPTDHPLPAASAEGTSSSILLEVGAGASGELGTEGSDVQSCALETTGTFWCCPKRPLPQAASALHPCRSRLSSRAPRCLQGFNVTLFFCLL